MQVTPRAIQKRIARMEDEGFLRRIERRGPKGSKGSQTSEFEFTGLIAKANARHRGRQPAREVPPVEVGETAPEEGADRCGRGAGGILKYDRTIVAYHGCDAEVATSILGGEPFKKSQNDYDWLGEGIYFWEYGADRAMKFAEDQRDRGKIKTPAIVGALIQLGNCFDLMDTKFTDELSVAYEMLKKLHEDEGRTLPENAGATPDKKLRRLDCAVLNFYLSGLENADEPIRSTPFGAVSSKEAPRFPAAASGTRATCSSRFATLLAS